ncbi:hypothetical protein FRB97_008192 [Tulasnella sp. 331]|nr:hypothetical protein FRB97_008192 [Tulasnella sp. 331]
MEMATKPLFAIAALNSGVVLMISIWEAQRSGLNVDVSAQVAGIQTCLKYLKRWENRSHLSGGLYDILRQTVSRSQVPATTSPQAFAANTQTLSHGGSTKRDRDSGSLPLNHPSQPMHGSLPPSQYTTNPLLHPDHIHTAPSPVAVTETAHHGSLDHAHHAIKPQGAFSAIDPSSHQWSRGPASFVSDTDSLPSLRSTWESSHPSSSLNMSNPAVGFDELLGQVGVQAAGDAVDMASPDAFWLELLGPLAGHGKSMGERDLGIPTELESEGTAVKYITALEERVERLENLIRRVAPNIDVDAEVGPSFNKDTWDTVKDMLSTRPSQGSTGQPRAPDAYSPLLILPDAMIVNTMQTPLLNIARTSTNGDTPTALVDLEGSDDERNLTSNDGTLPPSVDARIRQLHLGDAGEKLYLGKAVQAARELRSEVSEDVNTTFAADPYPPDAGVSRLKFWKPNPWERMSAVLPAIEKLRFPPPDLIGTLINHCFEDVMPLLPLLHRPSFEQQYSEGRHRHDLDFAMLLLAVSAIGARHSNDARLCLTSPEGGVEWGSAGWLYFAQVYQMTKPIYAAAKLVDVQIMALAALYLEGTSACESIWLFNGIDLLYAQTVGAHRERLYASEHTFLNQMWKRVFWCLVQKDRESSAGFGRAICIYDEDIDAELPLEVDDDGWNETTQSWVQPAGKPSQLAYLNQHAELMKILAHLAELDSALNAWLDALPAHLKWDQHMGAAWYQQAAALQVTFYYVQITIHRPFIQLSSSSKRALSLPSLAVCANAARSSALNSGVVLMISVWEAQRSGLNVDVSAQVAGIQTCLKYLKRWENRSYISGRLYDVLRQTVSRSQVPAATSPQTFAANTQTSPHGASMKRDRDSGSTLRVSTPAMEFDGLLGQAGVHAVSGATDTAFSDGFWLDFTGTSAGRREGTGEHDLGMPEESASEGASINWECLNDILNTFGGPTGAPPA